MAAHVGLEIAKHGIQLVLFQGLTFSRVLLILVGRVGLGDVNARLRALNAGQRALRTLGGLVGLRVRGVRHRLMLMSAAVDL